VTEKPSFEQYLIAAAAELGFRDDPGNAKRSYTFNLRAAHQSLMAGDVMARVLAVLKEIRHQYGGGKPDLLFYPPEIVDDLRVLQKPFRSVIEKLYRRNVLYNRNYPNPPREGFLTPVRLYEEIDDLLRARVICKYMDGPRYVCEQLKHYCNSWGVISTFRELSTDAGYYAWHFYFKAPVELMIDNVVHQRSMWVEIQVSTQLADVITALTHSLYEARRTGNPGIEGRDWKWDATSRQFRSAYLGHGLHLLEGIIQTFKDDVLGTAPEMPTPQPETGTHCAPNSSADQEPIQG
jgi:ppGpp synthetase/RelA/SpoT-type nucleotidyltranferase